MKKILLLMFVALTSIGASAQEHLSFLGYPMGVTISDFTTNIRQRFPLQKKVGGDSYYIFKGNVYGHDSYFKAEYSRKTKIVYKITVTPKQVEQNALIDSLVVHHGQAMEVQGGYRWNVEGGTVFLYTPDGYDPVLMYFDERGVERFREEK